MPRPPRICIPGSIAHVTIRGNNQQPIFLSDRDRNLFLDLLGRYKIRFQFQIYSYTLMDNHVHLLLSCSQKASLSRVMQVLTTQYARWFNRRYRRNGHLFQGRFHSSWIGRDPYFVVVSRYIHLNPVRAGLVDRPSKYPWSSYRATIGLAPNNWLDLSFLLNLFGVNRESQIRAYQEFVENGV